MFSLPRCLARGSRLTRQQITPRSTVRQISVDKMIVDSFPEVDDVDIKPATPWSLGRLNHVAIAVPDLAAATAMYRDVMGATVSEPQALPEHGVTVVFVQLENTKLELLEPLGKSPIAGFLEKNKMGGMHHVCIEVEDINVAVADLKAKNVRCLAEEPKIGAHGKPVMFLHPKDCNGVLLELEQV